ncbi:MAG: multidrug ABC transporter permease [Terriglobia bacterium]|nr:MAG: multidrug ABC transporter permease [Terriglobia bacterium]
MNAVYALWLRQVKRFVRSRTRIVAALGQPLLFLVAFGFGFRQIYSQAGHGDYLQFLAPGIIGMTTMFAAVFTGVELIWDRQFGFLKETLVAPVPRRLIMLGRTAGGATVAVMQGSIVIAVCLLAGFRVNSLGAAVLGAVFMILIALLFTAFGSSMASVVQDFQAFQLILQFMVMPMFFLSGALFPLKNVPRPLQIVASIDPFSYGVDGLRAALSGTGPQFGFAVDLAVLITLAVFLVALGGRLFSKIQI